MLHDPHLFRLSTKILPQLHNWRSATGHMRQWIEKEQRRPTFKIGLNDDPDNVPQADGVKLWDPTYAHPTAGSTTSISSSVSSSVSDDSSSWRFLDEGLSCNIAIIIFVFNLFQGSPRVYEWSLPLNASIQDRPYFWSHKIGLWENFWRPTVSSDKTTFHLPETGTLINIIY